MAWTEFLSTQLGSESASSMLGELLSNHLALWIWIYWRSCADCTSCTASSMALCLFQSPLRHEIAVTNLLCDLCYRPSTDPSVTTFSVADRSNPPIRAFYAYTLRVAQQRGTLRIFRSFALSNCDITLVVTGLK